MVGMDEVVIFGPALVPLIVTVNSFVSEPAKFSAVNLKVTLFLGAIGVPLMIPVFSSMLIPFAIAVAFALNEITPGPTALM